MKIIKLLLLFIVFTTNFVQSQNFKNASKYLDFVSNEQEIVSKNMWKHTRAVAHSKSDKNIQNKRNYLIKSIGRAILKIEKAKSFEGEEFKAHILENLNLSQSLLKEEYEKIIDMKAVSEQSYDAMEAYILARELADKKMEDTQKEYEKHFYEYAAKHHIQIIENESELSKNMKISGEVFDHYNKLYLIFFKVHINEIYLWDAIERGDVSAIQQNSSALGEEAKAGLEILKNVTLYKNDTSLKNATRTLFEYFIDESENKIPQLVEFLILNEDFEKISTNFEETPERKRTKEMVDGYNKKVNQLNEAVKNYNKVNQLLNNKRQTMINQLNTSNSDFLSRHIPNVQ